MLSWWMFVLVVYELAALAKAGRWRRESLVAYFMAPILLSLFA